MWARTDEAITALENRLANGGYNLIAPMLPETNRLDPDYPRVSTLTLDQLIPPPAPPAKPKPAAN